MAKREELMKVYGVKLSKADGDYVRRIARREDRSISAVLRRLVKKALRTEARL